MEGKIHCLRLVVVVCGRLSNVVGLLLCCGCALCVLGTTRRKKCRRKGARCHETTDAGMAAVAPGGGVPAEKHRSRKGGAAVVNGGRASM